MKKFKWINKRQKTKLSRIKSDSLSVLTEKKIVFFQIREGLKKFLKQIDIKMVFNISKLVNQSVKSKIIAFFILNKPYIIDFNKVFLSSYFLNILVQ